MNGYQFRNLLTVRTVIVLTVLLLIAGLFEGANALQPISVEMRQHNGAPTIFIDNQPVFGVIMGTADNVQEQYLSGAKDAGIHIYSIFQTPAGGERPAHPDTWLDAETFDYAWNDASIDRIVAIDPEAKFAFRVGLYTPPWWDELNMGEMIVFSDGVVRRRVRGARSSKETQGSWASEKWREAVGSALRKYIRHVESKYGDRTVMFHLAASYSYEWYWPGSMEGWIADYSIPNRDRFRSWLREKYGAVEKLQKVWGDPTISFDAVEIPTHYRRTDGLTDSHTFGFLRQKPHWLWYWNPNIFRYETEDQAVVDYTLYHSAVVVETINYFAKIVREETKNTKLVGASYGYAHLRDDVNAHFMGKNAQTQMLKSPYIQYQVSPPLAGWSLTAPERREGLSQNSMALHNHMYLLAIDHAIQGNRKTDFERLKKKFNAIFINNGMGYFEVMKGRFDHEPDLWPLISQMYQIGQRSFEHPRGEAAEIAIIGDEESLAWMNLDGLMKVGSPYGSVLNTASIIGAPYDFYLHNDLGNPGMPDYKLYILTDLYALSETELNDLEQKVKRNNSTALWMYAPGYLNDLGKSSIERMSALVGIDMGVDNFVRDKFQWTSRRGVAAISMSERYGREIPGEEYRPPSPGSSKEVSLLALPGMRSPQVIETVNGAHPILNMLPDIISFGNQERLGPRFYVLDPAAETLGTYSEGGRVGFAVKEMDGWRSVYIGATELPSQILRAVARDAGVHEFTESDDVIYTNASYFAVRCRTTGGYRHFKLPREAYVRELYSGTEVGSNISEFVYSMEPETSYLFYCGKEPYYF